MKQRNELINTNVFSHEKFGELQILTLNGMEHFPAVEVAKKLGYSNPSDAVIRHCRKSGVVFHDITDSMGRRQKKKFINEGNLYRLIIKSHLTEAEAFESWVFDEVLPTLRKTGGYVANEDVFIETYLSEADENTKNLFKSTLKAMKSQNELMHETKEKVVFAKALETSNKSILVGELAKLIHQNGIAMGQNRLYKWLRNKGYLMKSGNNYNLPTQKSMDLGLFEVKKRTIVLENGMNKPINTTMVTGKGQVYFINKILNEDQVKE